MRIFILTFLCIPTLTNAQYVRSQNIGQINDPDGYTFIREGQSSTTQIVDTLFTDEFFRFYPNDSSNWFKVNKQFFKGTKSSGYVHNSRITNLKAIHKTEQYKLIDSIFNKETELQTKYDHNSSEYFGISDRFHEEKFDLLLPIFISYFCKYVDINLLDKYLRIMSIESDSPDELPSMTLVQIYICQPQAVIDRMRLINDRTIDGRLEDYFRGLQEIDHELDNYPELSQILNDYLKR